MEVTKQPYRHLRIQPFWRRMLLVGGVMLSVILSNLLNGIASNLLSSGTALVLLLAALLYVLQYRSTPLRQVDSLSRIARIKRMLLIGLALAYLMMGVFVSTWIEGRFLVLAISIILMLVIGLLVFQGLLAASKTQRQWQMWFRLFFGGLIVMYLSLFIMVLLAPLFVNWGIRVSIEPYIVIYSIHFWLIGLIFGFAISDVFWLSPLDRRFLQRVWQAKTAIAKPKWKPAEMGFEVRGELIRPGVLGVWILPNSKKPLDFGTMNYGVRAYVPDLETNDWFEVAPPVQTIEPGPTLAGKDRNPTYQQLEVSAAALGRYKRVRFWFEAKDGQGFSYPGVLDVAIEGDDLRVKPGFI